MNTAKSSIVHSVLTMPMILRAFSPGDRVAVIFDIGANEGQSMREYARRFPEAAIYSFEPVRATYKKLLEASRPFRNVRAIPLALGSKREQVKIELTGLSVQNSLRNRANGNSGICGSSVANANSEPDIEIAPETVVAGFNLWEKLE